MVTTRRYTGPRANADWKCSYLFLVECMWYHQHFYRQSLSLCWTRNITHGHCMDLIRRILCLNTNCSWLFKTDQNTSSWVIYLVSVFHRHFLTGKSPHRKKRVWTLIHKSRAHSNIDTFIHIHKMVDHIITVKLSIFHKGKAKTAAIRIKYRGRLSGIGTYTGSALYLCRFQLVPKPPPHCLFPQNYIN